MRTQVTASAFWSLFRAPTSPALLALPELEVLRHRCLLGFTALEAALETFWQSSVLPEWDETRSLISVTLDAPASDETLDELIGRAGTGIKKAQLVATLRFLSLIENDAKFSPNFFDFASYLLLRRSDDEYGVALVRQLCLLHELRASSGPASKAWSEITAHRSVKSIEETAEMLSKLGRNFAEAFDDSRSEATASASEFAA